ARKLALEDVPDSIDPIRGAAMTHFLVLITMLWASSASAQVLRDVLWVTNGGVYASAVVGNTLYLGGNFNRVGPATGGLVPAGARPGAPQLSQPPLGDGKLNAMLADGAGGWSVGGAFLHINGVARNSLAR